MREIALLSTLVWATTMQFCGGYEGTPSPSATATPSETPAATSSPSPIRTPTATAWPVRDTLFTANNAALLASGEVYSIGGCAHPDEGAWVGVWLVRFWPDSRAWAASPDFAPCLYIQEVSAQGEDPWEVAATDRPYALANRGGGSCRLTSTILSWTQPHAQAWEGEGDTVGVWDELWSPAYAAILTPEPWPSCLFDDVVKQASRGDL